jgi:ubiquinone biosynthesis monooxygenase Coq7
MSRTRFPDPDTLIVAFDRALRTLWSRPHSSRPVPGNELPEPDLSDAERRHAAALMRVNHSGEVCAQALYQGQAMTARSDQARQVLEKAASEEMDHLAWTAQRIEALGGRTSLLNPFWYGASFAMGALSGLAGDGRNLGFLAETERQVEGHLEGHLDRLPALDEKSRAVVAQMKDDEARHARSAMDHGAVELPYPAKKAMAAVSRVMTRTTYWV